MKEHRYNTFLGCLADAYLEKYNDLSEFCFVFPSRRSATFFLKRLGERVKGLTMIAPEAMAAGNFMSRISGLDVAPRVTQIMQLYLAYRDIRKRLGDINSDAELVDFDEFLPWGEVVLSDFSDVDMNDVNVEEIFKNVIDYRSIATDYLTPEQKEVISRYFGYTPSADEVRGFWKSINDMGPDSVIKRKYMELWQLLPELYTELRRRLEHPGDGDVAMCMAGSGYRMAMEKVLEKGMEALPWKHVVVAGLDSLSQTEVRTMEALSKLRDADGEPVIEFFWDLTGPVLERKEDMAGAVVRRFRMQDNFGEPEWARPFMEKARSQRLPEIKEIGVPSNAMQAKVAGEWVERLLEKGNRDSVMDARVAVVLPDENLLLPLLYSLPLTKDESVNLTMGWSMRYTSTAAMMHHLQRTLNRVQTAGGQQVYLSSDIRLLIAQPLVQMLIGPEKSVEINTSLGQTKRRTLPWRELKELSAELGFMLRPVNAGLGIVENAEWLEELLNRMDLRVAHAPEGSKEGAPVMKSRIERMQIQAYLTALGQLVQTAAAMHVEMRFNTLFYLLSRMVGSGKIQFEGMPLQGLQVMGLLETRALDFDKVIVLSMNDKVMPSQAHRRSFITDSMRRAYGMPLSNSDEKRYAYWFYRLLSRTDEAALVYDSRVGEGMRSGGKSRYLLQLEKLYAREGMGIEKRTFTLGSSPREREAVKKTEHVMDMIRLFSAEKKDLPEGEEPRNLSASALQTYLKCPLQFYYRYVLGYKDDPIPSGCIDQITQGNIFHNVMLNLYFAKDEQRKFIPGGKTFTKEQLQAMHDDDALLNRLMRRAVNKEYNGLKEKKDLDRPLIQSSQMIADRLVQQVKGILKYDISRAPLTLYGGEIKETVRWHVKEGLDVNMTASFDRADRSLPFAGEPADACRPRIVDFKTGSVHLDLYQAGGLPGVFEGKYQAGNVFQLLLYANMFDDLLRRKGEKVDLDRGVEMAIFDANAMEHGERESHPTVDSSKTMPLLSHTEGEDHMDLTKFRPMLDEKISELFDPETPFMPTEDERQCEFCVMRRICGY